MEEDNILKTIFHNFHSSFGNIKVFFVSCVIAVNLVFSGKLKRSKVRNANYNDNNYN